MIAVNELMLGNYVGCITGNNIYTVTSIRQQKAKDGYYKSIELNHDETYLPEHIKGIPLTSDIFHIAGFLKSIRSYTSEKGWHYLTYIKNKKRGVRESKRVTINLTIDPNGKNKLIVFHITNHRVSYHNEEFYLHQLQNLYHALTGEELTINMISETVK